MDSIPQVSYIIQIGSGWADMVPNLMFGYNLEKNKGGKNISKINKNQNKKRRRSFLENDEENIFFPFKESSQCQPDPFRLAKQSLFGVDGTAERTTNKVWNHGGRSGLLRRPGNPARPWTGQICWV